MDTLVDNVTDLDIARRLLRESVEAAKGQWKSSVRIANGFKLSEYPWKDPGIPLAILVQIVEFPKFGDIQHFINNPCMMSGDEPTDRILSYPRDDSWKKTFDEQIADLKRGEEVATMRCLLTFLYVATYAGSTPDGRYVRSIDKTDDGHHLCAKYWWSSSWGCRSIGIVKYSGKFRDEDHTLATVRPPRTPS